MCLSSRSVCPRFQLCDERKFLWLIGACVRSFVSVTDGSLAFLWLIGVCVRPYISETDGSLASLSPIGTCIRPKIDFYCRHLGIPSVLPGSFSVQLLLLMFPQGISHQSQLEIKQRILNVSSHYDHADVHTHVRTPA